VHRLYVERFGQVFVEGKNGPLPGFLLEHLLLQDIIHVAAIGGPRRGGCAASCRPRARNLGSSLARMARKNGTPLMAWWEGGMYENEYVKEGGLWKLKLLNYNPLWHADYATGWSHSRPNYVPKESTLYPKDPTGPDALMAKRPLWPDTDVVPFHYPHPVTARLARLEGPRRLGV